MEYQRFISGKIFYDNTHFPRGFGRSGIFSIRESAVIEQTGVFVRALVDGETVPVSDEQRRLVEVILGNQPATTSFEKLWSKYYTHISVKRCPKNLSSSKMNFSGDDGGSGYIEE